MKAGIGILVVVLLALGLFGCQAVGIRNDLVTQKEGIKAAWAQVDNALQRRADLLPNLVETVKGFAKQEQDVFGKVAEARAAMAGARTPQERIAANSQVESALGRLLVVSENYPDLKSNTNFLRLQDELSGTENRIARERQRYNDTVQRYNTDIQIFPKNLVAGLFGFTNEDTYFKTDPAKREVPQVKF
jgi:LemA protein